MSATTDEDNRKSKSNRRQRKKHTATADTYLEEDEELVNVIIENLEKELRHGDDGTIKWSGNDEDDNDENESCEGYDDNNDDGEDSKNNDDEDDEDLEDEEDEESVEDSEDDSEEEDTDEDDDEEDEMLFNTREGEINNNFIEIEELQEINDDEWKASGHGDHDEENENSIDSYESCNDALKKPARDVINTNKTGGASYWYMYAFIGGLLLSFTVYCSIDTNSYFHYLTYFTNKTDKNKWTIY